MEEWRTNVEALQARALDELRAASEAEALERWRVAYLGRRGALTEALRGLSALPVEARPAAGQATNEAKRRLEAAAARREVELRDQSLTRAIEDERLDVSLPGRPPVRGGLHPTTLILREITGFFQRLGYQVVEGPEVELDRYNFEMLNIPADHPARDMWDTLYVKLGSAESVELRTHTSPVQIRVMESQPPPIRIVAPGRCYRRDTPDARHLPVFNQIEGLVVDRNITFGDLAGTIEEFTKVYFGAGIHSRLRPSYFPFTEPSAEFEVTCFVCGGDGCRVCSNSGWIELGGCGMVDPNVFAAVGIDPEEWSGFAFGFGIDRCAMVRYDIDDIRHFITNDIRFLSQF